MNNLINFLIKHVAWFIFIFYVVVSCVLLFQSNPYQQSVYLSSANAVSSTVFKGYSTVTSYFGLKAINEELQERNAELEMEVVQLKKEAQNLKENIPDTTAIQPVVRQFDYVVAHVISNSISQPYNYITIDRGEADGIYPEMGVVDHNGVVGMVNVVGKHSARVISLLNPDMKLSCKVKRNQYFGSLQWNGVDPAFAVLRELPKQGKYQKGDTIITSGYSAVFPEGIIVGIVEGRQKELNDNFASLKVRLGTNFMQLSTVRAIKNTMKVELKAIKQNDADANGKKPEKKQDKEHKKEGKQ